MPLAAAALSAARRGASTITALLEAVLLDPSLDWISANRAAAAHRHLDSAMALSLWTAHLQVCRARGVQFACCLNLRFLVISVTYPEALIRLYAVTVSKMRSRNYPTSA